MSESTHVEQGEYASFKESQIHQTVSGTTSTWTDEPYQVMLCYNDMLVTALSHNPEGIAGILLAKGLISKNTEAQMHHQSGTPLEKAVILVGTVRQRIKIAPKRFQEFLDVLSMQEWTKEIAQFLESCIGYKYSRKDVSIRPRPASDSRQFESEEYNFRTLDSYDEVELEAQLILSAESMKRKFATLLWQTVESFKRQKINPHTLIREVLAVTEYEDPAIGNHLLEREKEVLVKAQSVDMVFDILRPHMSFFHYEILEFLIEMLGSLEDRQQLQVYLSDFRSFCHRCTFTPLPVQGTTENSIQSYRPRFIVKITRTFKSAFLAGNKINLDNIMKKHIQRKFAIMLQLNVSSLYLEFIDNGMKHYEAYQLALQDGEYLTLLYMKFLFFGPPRSGKTSMRRRLIREILNLSQFNGPSVSTGVAETNEIIIKKFVAESAAISTGSQWWSIKRVEVSTQVDTYSKGDLHYLAQLFYQLICRHTTSATRKHTTSATSSSEPTTTSVMNQPTLIRSTSNDDLEISPSMASMDAQNSKELVIESEEREIESAFEKLTSMLQSDSPEELKRLLEELILINMMDVGGQPAFLDMLPALTIGPALYLLFFRLDQELKINYPVWFLPDDGKCEIKLKSSYNIEEVLFRSLASIACFSSHNIMQSHAVSASMTQESTPASIPQGPDSVESLSNSQASTTASKPQASTSAESGSKRQASSRALLFGTYKDKVNEDQISQIEQTLQEKFTRTKLYRERLLQKSGKGKMMFTVDNMFGTDESEMSDIREDIERIIKANFPPIPIPTSWLMFRIVLQLLNKPVVSLAQCEEIAKRLSMPTPVEEAIWFFHHNIGSLMHYPDIPSMEDIVICDPQVIFDCISTLIIDKFKYKNRDLGSQEVDEFYQKGQFCLSHIKDETGRHNSPLTLNQLVDLLTYHNILAELKNDNQDINPNQMEPKFIMPAVLNFASGEELNTTIATGSEGQSITPIMIHFDGGFVPFGVFSTCTAYLIAHQDSMSPKWRLCENQVRRNKVKFSINGAFYATIIARPRYLETVVSRHPGAMCKRSLPEICSTVRQTVTETLKAVISKMKYKPFGTSTSTDQPFDVAFACCLEDSHSDHLMKVVETEGEQCANCLKDDMNVDLKEKHHIWFSLPPSSESEGERKSSRSSGKRKYGESSYSSTPSTKQKVRIDKRAELPTLKELTTLKYTEGGENKKVRIIKEASHKWKDIVSLISDDPNRISVLEQQHRGNVEDCLRQALIDDFINQKPEEYSHDWRGLIELLKDVDLTALSEKVKHALLHK